MRWFYALSLLVVAALVASPFALLKEEKLDRFAGKVVGHNIYGAKVNSVDSATCGDTTSTAIQGNFYEGLYTYHYLKRPVEVIEQPADEMPQVSSDGPTYTIKLKKDVKYFRNPCVGVGAGQRQGGHVARRRRPASPAAGAT